MAPRKGRTRDENNEGYCHLRAFPAEQVFLGKQPKEIGVGDTTLLGVVCTRIDKASARRSTYWLNLSYRRVGSSLEEMGYLGQLYTIRPPGHFQTRLVCSADFGVNFANDCLNCYRSNHGLECQQKDTDPKLKARFRVIDCNTSIIIPAPLKCEYTALSYVWGPSSASGADAGSKKNNNNIWSVPDNCPEVSKSESPVSLGR